MWEIQAWIVCRLILSTDSQNQRIVEVGRDLWRSCAATPQLKQGHLEQVVKKQSTDSSAASACGKTLLCLKDSLLLDCCPGPSWEVWHETEA